MPTTSPVRVSGSSPARWATPKSASLATPAAERGASGISTFWGLTSRCTTPRSCACASAPHSASPIAQHVAVAQQAVGAEVVDRPPVHQLGHQVARLVVLAGVEDGDDPGMVEPARGERLALGARRIAAAAGRDHLDRDGALEPLVRGGVDRPEPARAEALAEPVAVQDEVRRERCRELVRDLHCRRFRCNGVIPSDPPVILGRPVAAEETRTLSFFDEDDEPTRTTSRTRTQTRVRPRAGRVRPARVPTPDSQALLVRRMVAVVVGALVLFALFFFVRSCNNTRTDNALEGLQPLGGRHRHRVAADRRLAVQARSAAAGTGSPNDLYNQIDAFKATSRQVARRRRRTSASRATWWTRSRRC